MSQVLLYTCVCVKRSHGFCKHNLKVFVCVACLYLSQVFVSVCMCHGCCLWSHKCLWVFVLHYITKPLHHRSHKITKPFSTFFSSQHTSHKAILNFLLQNTINILINFLLQNHSIPHSLFMASSSHNTFEGVDDETFDQYFDQYFEQRFYQAFENFSIDCDQGEQRRRRKKKSSYRKKSWRRWTPFMELLFQWKSNISCKSFPTAI